jgi:transcriptional regulator with XRE-family HTH domain
MTVNGSIDNSDFFYKIPGMAKAPPEDPVMQAIRKAVDASKMTQQELGEKMGYPADSARQSVSQFLRSHDPRVGMIRRCAKALGVPVSRLLKD